MTRAKSNPEGKPFTATPKRNRRGEKEVLYRPRIGNKRERVKLDPDDAKGFAQEVEDQIDQRRREAGARMQRARAAAAAKREREQAEKAEQRKAAKQQRKPKTKEPTEKKFSAQRVRAREQAKKREEKSRERQRKADERNERAIAKIREAERRKEARDDRRDESERSKHDAWHASVYLSEDGGGGGLSAAAERMLTEKQRKAITPGLRAWVPAGYLPSLTDGNARPAVFWNADKITAKNREDILRAVAADITLASFGGRSSDPAAHWYLPDAGAALVALAQRTGYYAVRNLRDRDPYTDVHKAAKISGVWALGLGGPSLKERYSITHIPTGMRVRAWEDRKQAEHVLGELADKVPAILTTDAKEASRQMQAAGALEIMQSRRNPSGKPKLQRAPVWAELGICREITVAPGDTIKMPGAYRLCYATHERTLYAFPAKPGRFPEEVLKRELYAADVLREKWQGRQPLEVHAWALDVPGKGERWQSLGPAKAIVYRSDKRSRTGAHTYIHEFGKGVRAEKYRETYRIRGGRLTVNDRGIVF